MQKKKIIFTIPLFLVIIIAALIILFNSGKEVGAANTVCQYCKSSNLELTQTTSTTHYYKCNDCTMYQDPEGHTGGHHTNGGKCTVCGYTYQSHNGQTLVYVPIQSGVTHAIEYHCTDCNYIIDSETRYCTLNPATCTTPQTCKDCGGTSGTALGHAGGTHDNGGKCQRCYVIYQTHDNGNSQEYVALDDGVRHNIIYRCGTCSQEIKTETYSCTFSDKSACTQTTKCKCGNTRAALGHTGATHDNGGVCTRTGCGTQYENHIKGSTVIRTVSQDDTYHTVVWSCYQAYCYGEHKEMNVAHTFGETTTIEATCTEDGNSTKTCTACNHAVTTTINATGHNWTEATCTTPKTCTKCKATEGNALGHTGATHDNEGKCTTCGEQYETHNMNTTPSSYVESGNGHVAVYECTFSECTFTEQGSVENHDGATHNNGGKCTKCKVSYETHSKSTNVYKYETSPLNHTPIYNCSATGCSEKYTGSTEQHIISEYTDKKNGTHSGECTTCNYTITESHNYKDGICEDCNAEKSKQEECNHTYEIKKNETQHWYECSKCKITKDNSLENHDIKYTDNTNGTHTGKCTVCQYSLEAENHKFENEVCTYCNAKEKNEDDGDDKCEHTYILQTNETQHWYECSECENIKENSKANHSVISWIDNGNGTHSGKCTVCNYIVKQNHNYKNEICKDCEAKQDKQEECEHKYDKKSDSDYHWDECSKCGEVNNKEKHTIGTSGKCDKCGRQQSSASSNNGSNNGNNNDNSNNGSSGDGTQSPNKLPNAGNLGIVVSIIAISLISLAGISIFKLKGYKDI